MDGGTVYALSVNAGLWELVAPLVVAFIDEDLVIHVARMIDSSACEMCFAANSALSPGEVWMSRAPTVM